MLMAIGAARTATNLSYVRTRKETSMSHPPRETLISASELSDGSDAIDSVRVSVIRFPARCEHGPDKCAKAARINIKASNGHGILIWHRVFCHDHAALLLEKAPTLGFWVIDD